MSTYHRTEIDLIVVGAGGAGMIAALTAARLGKRILLVEKGEAVGGTTRLSVGTIMASGTQQQKELGIEDSAGDHAEDLDNIRLSMGIEDDADLRQLLTENVADSVAVLRGIGVNFMDPLVLPPHRKARMHQVMPTSRSYIDRLTIACAQESVTTVVNTRATGLIVEDDRVVGLNATTNGETVSFYAKGGVILASGDIAGDTKMMHKYLKTWQDGVVPYNPVNTGDGHKMAEKIGAHIVPRKDLVGEVAAHIRFVLPKESIFQKIPTWPFFTKMMLFFMKIVPDAIIRPIMMRFLTTTLGPDVMVYREGGILVNKTGARFTDETKMPSLKIPDQPDGEAYIIFDETFAKKFSGWPYFISTAPGVAYAYLGDYRAARPDLYNMAATPELLAQKMGFKAKTLKKSLDEANNERAENKLDTGPYYALGPVKTWIMVSPVGLAVNTSLEILRKDGTVIPGLYGAGGAGMGGFTVTGHGHGLGWAFTSGRLAAERAVEMMGS